MNTPHFLNLLHKTTAIESRFDVIERYYKVTLSNEARLISSLDMPIFWAGRQVCRLMSLSEITHAESDLHVAFSKKGLIPFFDRGDNNFIVFVPAVSQWGMFNINDEILWHQGRSLTELLP